MLGPPVTSADLARGSAEPWPSGSSLSTLASALTLQESIKQHRSPGGHSSNIANNTSDMHWVIKLETAAGNSPLETAG